MIEPEFEEAADGLKYSTAETIARYWQRKNAQVNDDPRPEEASRGG